MRARRALAVLLWLLTVAMSIVELWMIAVTLDRPSDQWGFRGYEAGLALAFGSTGALVALRQPRNAIGWIVLTTGLVCAVQGIAVQYVVLAEATGGASSGVFLGRWIGSWIWVVAVGSFLAIFPLLFPNGRLPSRRWRPALVFAFAAIGIQVGLIIANTEPLGPVPATNNPATWFAVMGVRGAIGYVLLWFAGAVSVGSLVQRYRHAETAERQQIKWVVYAIVLIAIGAAVGMTPLLFGQLFFLAGAFVGAGAIAVAILRYRLYEIDLIINRTLVYGVLSAVLAGVYTASITLSTRVFQSVTNERSDAAIVLTTLIVVSLFTPLRTRLQAIVDRRINPATSAAPETAAVRSSLEALDALARLIEVNKSGGMTAREFRAKKSELLRRV